MLESIRKSLKTECKQLSVALVSRIRLSNCFSISCVFDSILWEKSCRNKRSCKENENINVSAFLKCFSDNVRKSVLFRAEVNIPDLPLSQQLKTNWHCSAASLQVSRVSPKYEHPSPSVHSYLAHLLFPQMPCSSAIRWLNY